MTTMQIDRAVVQQVLEALDAGVPISPKSILHDWFRAALAQQAEQRRATPVMQQALEILESDFTTVDGEFCRWCDGRLNAKHNCKLEQTIAALRAALAQQAEPVEPVAEVFVRRDGVSFAFWLKAPPPERTKLYTAPPQQAEPVQEPEGMVEFLADLQRSRTKYPKNRRMFDGLMGEIDELRRAYAGDGDIRAEAFDVAVCAFRIATEGDAGGNARLEQAEPVQEPVAWMDALKDAFFEGFTSVATYNDTLLNSPEEAWNGYKPPRTTPPRCPNCASLEAQNNELDRKLAELEGRPCRR